MSETRITKCAMLPTAQLGYILAPRVGDAIHHQFYLTCPPELMLVVYPLNLGSFTEAGVEAALESYWPAFDFLVSRKVDRIVQGGIPLSAFAGRDRVLGLLEEARRRAPSIPSTVDFEEVIEGFKLLGCRKLALAGKWEDALMARVAASFARPAWNRWDGPPKPTPPRSKWRRCGRRTASTWRSRSAGGRSRKIRAPMRCCSRVETG